MSKIKKIAFFLFALAIIYLLGPRWEKPILNNSPSNLSSLSITNIDKYVTDIEASVSNMKPNNQAEIVWANDSIKSQTDYCFVYLAGFGASKGEGEPIHREVAARYGMNLYLARLSKQGITEEEPFIDLEEEALVNSAKEAINIGKILGKKVIILSCSTGSTLGLYLAANDPSIASVVAYSPNIDLADPTSELLTMPWGLQLARLFMGSNYRGFEANDTVKKFWINYYRLEGVLCLKSLIQNTMTDEIFKAITQPIYMAYYYKNETKKDDIVSIPRMKEVFDLLGTPNNKKRLVSLANVSGHCMASQYFSSEEELDVIRQETFSFLEEVLTLKVTTF